RGGRRTGRPGRGGRVVAVNGVAPLAGVELVLVLGGQRSGKSAFGERLAATGPRPVTYIATARVDGDPDLAARVRRHQDRRDPSWTTVEASDDLELPDTGTVLVDGLGLWLAALAAAPAPAP